MLESVLPASHCQAKVVVQLCARRAGRTLPTARRRTLCPAGSLAITEGVQPGPEAKLTCRTCKQLFAPSENSNAACRHHPAIYTGGELGKYTGFVPDSPAYADRMKVRGMVYFWDCCGATDRDAAGCVVAAHVSFDGQS